MVMPNTATSKRRILVVEDEIAVQHLIKLLLETRGYEVIVAETAKESFQKAARGIDLILLDLTLPDVEGLEVCHRFKTLPETQYIPLIILSARRNSEDKIQGFHFGADDYIAKPFEHEELFARMEAVLRREHSVDQDERIQHFELLHELNRIVDQRLVEPCFQPIYFLKPLQLLGLEVLCRPSTQTVLSNPEVLFKAAMQFGLYKRLEMIVWEKALKMIGRVLKNEYLFLNCNPYLIEGTETHDFNSLFRDNGVSIKNVFLEITERSAIGEFKTFYSRLKRYRDFGFKIAVDDVGAGYASLESIVETHPDVVKIDQHIIQGVHEDPFKRSIVKFIVSFCRENKILSIAEGIETKEDFNLLLELGVDAGQGYYLHRPTFEVNMNAFQRSIHN